MKTICVWVAMLSLCLVTGSSGVAGEPTADAQAKKKLLGYWKSPRHAYLISSDGIMYMCPRNDATTTNKWDVKGGRFYQDADAYEIVSLTGKKFVYRGPGKDQSTFTLTRTTEKEAEQ